MSQLLQRLQHELQTASDPIRRGELTARIAANYARVGRFEEARQNVSNIRQAFGAGQSGIVTVWTMLAEGLIHLFGELSPAAYDRISRAQVLSLAMNYKPALAIASAWKAHLEFDRSDFGAMARSLAIGINNSSLQDLDAITRIAIVLSNAHMHCGEREAAQIWFARGHAAAVRNQDQASIEALLYNRTAFGISEIRAQRCIEGGSQSSLDTKRKEVESSKNLQELTQAAALTNQIHLWSARLAILEGEFSKASVALEAIKGMSPFSAHNFNKSIIDLEIAYCLLMSQRDEEAFRIHSQIDFQPLDSLEIDDRMVAYWLRFEMSKRSRKFDTSIHLESELNSLRSIYLAQRRELASQLASLSVEHPWRLN